ncbi:MAG TPA: matrixin family metalloprotease [Polyangiaceae bacterium]|nr:matrixin family metalloprotease [Polyangiaceae bacterium]
MLSFSTLSQATTKTHGSVSEASRNQNSTSRATAPAVMQRWHQGEVRVVLDSSLQQLPVAALKLIEDSFQTWNDTGATLPVVTFESGVGAKPSLEPDGKNTVLVAPITYAGHETDLAITIAFSHPKTGKISEADIIINQKYVFKTVSSVEAERSCRAFVLDAVPSDQESCTGSLASDACSESYDLLSVVTHEVGHFWGLGENYEDTRATMFSCTSACEVHKRDLNTVDVDEITARYDAASFEEPAGCTTAQIARGAAPTRYGTWLLCALLATTALARRRAA